MDFVQLSMQVARVDERTQTMREEMHNSFHRLEKALQNHIEDDARAHHRIAELEHIVARGKGAWKVVIGVASTLAGIAGVAYYVMGLINH